MLIPCKQNNELLKHIKSTQFSNFISQFVVIDLVRHSYDVKIVKLSSVISQYWLRLGYSHVARLTQLTQVTHLPGLHNLNDTNTGCVTAD